MFTKKKAPVPDLPRDFGYKCQWLAIRTNDMPGVATALGLSRVAPANWAMGIEKAYSGKIFVSPVVGDWVLVIGQTLPDAGDEKHPDRMSPLLVELSRRFGEVQYLGSHRVVGYQAWAKAVQGEIIRAYAYLGERGAILWNKGEKTAEEIRQGHNFFDATSPEANDEGYWEREDLRYPNEEDVMAMARAWSVDPSFSTGQYEPGVGVVGVLRKRHGSS